MCNFSFWILVFLTTRILQVLATAPPRASWQNLPNATLFPGLWEEYISAPADKTCIRPSKIVRTKGDVTGAERIVSGSGRGPESVDQIRIAKAETDELVLGRGGLVTIEFAQNIGGRVCLDVRSVEHQAFVSLSFSESPAFADHLGDATTDRQERDLPLLFPILHSGVNCVRPEFVRGAFKYMTLFIPSSVEEAEGFWHDGNPPDGWVRNTQDHDGQQKPLGPEPEPKIVITDLWVNCTSFPSNPHPRAYTGYFHSSSPMLNRIWYAGAYTLQLSTIDPREGSALIDYNRNIDHNNSPQGSWYSNFTIARGNAVTTDGAKRDRMVWPGDMSIAVPGIAVSTYDMAAVRNALDILFEHQYPDGSLPYAGPPMGMGGEFSDTYHLHTLLGVWNYVLYSGDLGFLHANWPAYVRALRVSISKVDECDLLHVSSTADWLRPGMTGHNLEASALLYEVLQKSQHLAEFLGDFRAEAQNGGLWEHTMHRLRKGIERLWCPQAGLFADNIGRRGCGGVEEVLPQDGNSWALLSGIVDSQDPRSLIVSESLRARWLKHGAPAVEFPNVISPFASSFELMAHSAAANPDAAVELMLVMWAHLLDGDGFTNSTLAEGFRVDGDAQYPAYWSSARNSHAHGWSTGPTASLLSDVLGIHLLEPLGKTWVIRPHLTKWLRYVQGGFATQLGPFEVKIKCVRCSSTNRPAEVLEIVTPEGTKGSIAWGMHEAKVNGGGRKTLARWLDDDDERKWIELEGFDTHDFPFPPTAASEEDLDVVRRSWSMSHEHVLGLIPDEEWVPPELKVRSVGLVDWQALKDNCVDKDWQALRLKYKGRGLWKVVSECIRSFAGPLLRDEM